LQRPRRAWTERHQVSNRQKERDHRLLDDILSVGATQEIATSHPATNSAFVAQKQEIESHRITGMNASDQHLIGWLGIHDRRRDFARSAIARCEGGHYAI